MSRSRQKTKITGYAKVGRGTMKFYRQQRAGEERAAQRELLNRASRGDESAADSLSYEQSPWDEWVCPRDGKHYWADGPEKYFRK